MRIRFQRTRVIGNGPAMYGYDAYVKLDELPESHRQNITHTTILDGDFKTRWANFTDAMLPTSHFDLPRGIARWDAFNAHKRTAEDECLRLARMVFPELVAAERWPGLWANGPDGLKSETAMVWAGDPVTWKA